MLLRRVPTLATKGIALLEESIRIIMAKKKIPFEIAPDFTLTDTNDNQVRLSDYRGKQNVVLTFLRGFM
jgi:hypothetical protein